MKKLRIILMREENRSEITKESKDWQNKEQSIFDQLAIWNTKDSQTEDKSLKYFQHTAIPLLPSNQNKSV